MDVTSPASLRWGAIMIACLVEFVFGVYFSAVWELFGVVLFATGGAEGVRDILVGPHVPVFRIMLSLVPEVIAGALLARTVVRGVFRNCFLFGVVSLLLSVVMAIALRDFSLQWDAVVCYAGVIPAALLGGTLGNDM